ncbi:carbohydrate kinase family protein [Terrimonas pollutisoli]|uniref:carbohydrate kinase family protein n=1 Tax=Terrimonas pollutisoli TaxID=3034147 RepID=UPI0023ED9FDC|nr:carbohydrate kinase [Terrimonas sp. H1YJ31]
MTDAKKIVCFGEILWDILPSGAVPGGAPMNVAYHLRKLGLDPGIVTRVGIDDRGKKLIDLLNENGITTDHIQLDYDIPTGIVNATANEHGEMQYDIVAPAAWDFIALDDVTVELVKSASHFIFGSLVNRNSTSRNTLFALLETAQQKVLDINLRPPHFNRQLVEDLLSRADIIKMNSAELELITGWFTRYKTMTDRIAIIQDRFKVPRIIVTMGGDGAMVNIEGELYGHPGYVVDVADTIGSGDSFLAAFLFKQLNNYGPKESLAFASALGALVASNTGGWPAYEINDIQKLAASQSAVFIQ